MKRLLGIISLWIIYPVLLKSQITTEVFPRNPQTGQHNYFGIRVTLSHPCDQDITVNGYIYDDGSYNTNNPFSVTVTSGNSSAETGDGYYQTSPAENAAIQVTSVSPARCYSSPNYFDSKVFFAGQLHSVLLTNDIFNFSIPSSGVNYDSAINLIMQFNKDAFLENEYDYFGQTQSSTVTNQQCQAFKYFAHYSDFRSRLLSSNDPISLDSFEIKVNAATFISQENKQLYVRISDVVRDNINGTLSNSDLEDSLVNMQNLWLDINEDNPTSDSYITAAILSIGVKSCQFWSENIDSLYDGISHIALRDEDIISGPNAIAFDPNSYFVVPVALDVAGAIIGAAGSAINQYVNNGSVQAGGVVVGAVLGAVSGSAGLVGKLGKWLKSLF